MNCTHKVLILGHSFVRRLNVFLHQSHDRRTVSDFHLSSVDLSFLGVGGRTVPKTLQFDIAKVKALQPEIIILELGSNDLCSVGRRPESVGSDIALSISSTRSLWRRLCSALPSHSQIQYAHSYP